MRHRLDLTPIRTRANAEIATARKETEKATARLDVQMRREIARIQKSYKQLQVDKRQEFSDSESEIERRYARKASFEVYDALETSYGIMQERSVVNTLSPVDLEKVRLTKEKLADISDPSQKNAMLEILRITAPNKDFIKAVETEPVDVSSHRTIYSYICAEKGKVHIVCPFKTNGNLTMAKALEDRLDVVLDTNEIDLRQGTNGAVIETTDKLKGEIIHFRTSMDAVNGYVVYSLRVDNDADVEKLVNGISEKLNQLQPEGFREARLTHQVLELDRGFMSYLVNNKPDKAKSAYDQLEDLKASGRTNLTYEEAMRITGRTQKSLQGARNRKAFLQTQDGIVLDSFMEYVDRKLGRNKY